MFKKLQQMPARLAAMILVLFVAVGVAGGNRNALARALVPVTEEVVSLQARLVEMTGKAANYLTIADRLGVKGEAVTRLTFQRQSALSLANNNAARGKFAAEALLSAGDSLNTAALEADAAIRVAVDSIPDDDPDRSIEMRARASAYDDWMGTRMFYNDLNGYNTAVARLQAVYRAVPSRWLWSGYNFQEAILTDGVPGFTGRIYE